VTEPDDVLLGRAQIEQALTALGERLVAPLLLGHPGTPGVDLNAVRDLLLRVSQLADDLPQIAELELSPVFTRPDGVQAVDARIRLQAAEPADAHLRRLH